MGEATALVEWVRMLALTMTQAGEPGVLLQHVSPLVYLDHWALRRFSEDSDLGARLTGILRDRGGTLALSWLNLGEYAAVSDPKQRRAAEPSWRVSCRRSSAFKSISLPSISGSALRIRCPTLIRTCRSCS